MLKNNNSIPWAIRTLITLVILIITVYIASAQQQRSSAYTILKTAKLKAAKEKKKVMLLFTASWNPWLPTLDSVIYRGSVAKILDKYYVTISLRAKERTLDTKPMEKIGASELFDKLYIVDSSAKSGLNIIPTIFLLDAKGNKLRQYSGFPELIPQFEQMLKQTSAITDVEIAVIDQRFKQCYNKISQPTATKVLDSALKEAAMAHKNVFLIFSASWCHWCRVLDTAMHNPECKQFFEDNYVICHLVVSEDSRNLLKQNSGGEEMLAKYQRDRNGIPFWVIFNSEGEHLADYTGCPTPVSQYADDYKNFENILKKTSAITDDKLAVIKKVFMKISVRNGLASSN